MSSPREVMLLAERLVSRIMQWAILFGIGAAVYQAHPTGRVIVSALFVIGLCAGVKCLLLFALRATKNKKKTVSD